MYQVLARKYRPQSFDELVGQDHVRITLANAIEQGRIAHGYIFAGQRGTGKTSVARILARCLNCVQGPTVQPCGQCSSCREIAAGSSVDVIEIDAASNRGINEIRELRENVRYRPARDRYKIFIIDEAHQITPEAFNALLKTLEEPPEWVVFVLCTTEAHKIPTTIASRCQQFVFRAIDYEAIVDRLRQICQQEGIEAGEDVLSVLAQAGEGSMRDSLSALDQAIACCGTRLVADEVRRLLGLFGLEPLETVAQALLDRDKRRMLELVRELEQSGHNLSHFCRELARYFRNLLVIKIAGVGTRLVAASSQDQERMARLAAQFSEEDLTRYLNITLDLFRQMQYALQPRLNLEVGLLRMIEAGRLIAIEEALAELRAKNPAGGELPYTREAGADQKVAGGSTRGDPNGPATAHPESATSATTDLKQTLYRRLAENNDHILADAVEHAELLVEPGVVRIRAPKEFHLSLKSKQLANLLVQLLGRQVRVVLEASQTEASEPAAQLPDEQALAERALSHPAVRRFRELFPGSQVRAVRNLKS